MNEVAASNLPLHNALTALGRSGTVSPGAAQPAGKSESGTADQVDISPAGRNLSRTSGQEDRSSSTVPQAGVNPEEAELDTAEQAELRKLQARDTEVRTHEQAHLAAAGQYAVSSASFSFQLGPDGKRYAIGGEVQIDISKESSPEETLQKMEVIARAALAPASPSAADRQIASRAAMIAAKARQEILQSGEGSNQVSESENSSTTSSDSSENESSSTRSEQVSPGSDPYAATLKLALDTYKSMQSLA